MSIEKEKLFFEETLKRVSARDEKIAAGFVLFMTFALGMCIGMLTYDYIKNNSQKPAITTTTTQKSKHKQTPAHTPQPHYHYNVKCGDTIWYY